jgi:hypothetical protein
METPPLETQNRFPSAFLLALRNLISECMNSFGSGKKI